MIVINRKRRSNDIAAEITALKELLRDLKGATSDVWVIAPNHRFVRTLSRFYELGSAATNYGSSKGADQ